MLLPLVRKIGFSTIEKVYGKDDIKWTDLEMANATAAKVAEIRKMRMSDYVYAQPTH